MRSRPRYGFFVAAAAALMLGACSDASEVNTPMPPPPEVEGLIIEIRPEEGDPESFLLETETNGTLEVVLAEDIDYGMDLQHLHEHMEEDLPVRVELEERDGLPVALSILDA